MVNHAGDHADATVDGPRHRVDLPWRGNTVSIVTMAPVLRPFADGAPNIATCVPSLKAHVDFSGRLATEMSPGGRMTLLQGCATGHAPTFIRQAF